MTIAARFRSAAAALPENAGDVPEAERRRHSEALDAINPCDSTGVVTEFNTHMDAVHQIIREHARRDARRAGGHFKTHTLSA